MVTVSYPGVYVQEVPSGVHTITGVATSIAAFFGRSARGPLNKAVRLLSLKDFSRNFHGPHPQSDLAKSVEQFFANGGTDCYVVRLAQGAEKAQITLRNLADDRNVLTISASSPGIWGSGLRIVVDYDTDNPDDTFNLHVYHEEEGETVDEEYFHNLSMDPESAHFAPAVVSGSSEPSRLIELALHMAADGDDPSEDPEERIQELGNLTNAQYGYSQSRRPFVSPLAIGDNPANDMRGYLTDLLSASGHFGINVNDTEFVHVDLSELDFTGIQITATVSPEGARDEIANLISSAINNWLLPHSVQVTCSWDRIRAEDVATNTPELSVLRITSHTEPFSSVRIRNSRSEDLAGPMMLGVVQGGIEVTRYSNMRPVPNGTVLLGDGSSFAAFTDGIDALAGLQVGDDTTPVSAILTELSLDGHSIPTGYLEPNGTSLWYESPGDGNNGVLLRLNEIAASVAQATGGAWSATLWGYHLAFLKRNPTINETVVPTVSGTEPGPEADNIRNAIDAAFAANVHRYLLSSSGESPYQCLPGDDPNWVADRGDDGDAPLITDYQGDEEHQTGFHALDSVDLFNLMVLPGDREITDADDIRQILGHASTYCEQHRAFLLIDPPVAWTSNGRPVASQSDVDALRQAVEPDHAAVFYPRIEYIEYVNGQRLQRMIGPSGMIAGLMARTDANRGVWKAPAGIEANLRGALDLEVNLTDRENGRLNLTAVNCLRKFPNGIVNWGARTLDGFESGTSEWKYISIRRFSLFLQESLYRGTKWVVFEPNDEPLWAQIRLNLNAFMMGLFRQGAFQGSTPDKAFFVKCDGETTTQNDRNQGRVNIEVGFAPLKPAEFVIIRIQQMAGELG